MAELNTFLQSELSVDGYTGCEIRPTPTRTEIIVRATKTREVLGEKGQRIRELTSRTPPRALLPLPLGLLFMAIFVSLVLSNFFIVCFAFFNSVFPVIQKRFGFREGGVELYAERVMNRGLSSIAQAESLRFKLLQGLPVRRAVYGVLRNVMENEAKGCEVIISGKGRTQRAKAMKFVDGYIKKSGTSAKSFLDVAVRAAALKSGVLGIRVTIMLPWDPTGKKGPKEPLADVVRILKPKKSDIHTPAQ